MRILLVIVSIAAFGCRGPDGKTASAHDAEGSPVSISLTLDRTTIAATDELTGTLHVEDRAPPRDAGESPKAWCAIMTWRLELANESAALLDLVVDEGVEGWQQPRVVSEERVVDFRFRIIPCPPLLERSRAGGVPLRYFDPGNHALRVVLDASDPGAWTMASVSGSRAETLVPLQPSFASRWIPFDVVEAGRPLDTDDFESILLTANDEQAARILDLGCSRLGASERMVAIVAHANGERRGRLAQAMVRHVYPGGEWWPDPGAWPAFRSLFTEIDESGLDCRSHDSPPFFARIAAGRSIPIQIHSSQFCNFKVLCVYQEATTANFALSTPRRTINSGDMVTARGLFCVTCDVHPRIWGWLLVE